MRSARIGAFGLLVILSACSGGSGQSLHPEGASGIVILPSGFADSFADLTVRSGMDKQPVGADGKFRVQVLGPGPALVTLTDASGKVVLLGYVDAASSGSAFAGGKGEVSVQQTALALLFYATGVFTVPATLWGQLRDLIAQSTEVTQLAGTVSARVVADTVALSDGDQQLVDAVKQAATSLLQSTRAGHHPTPVLEPLDSSRTLLLVDPSGEQSGVEVLNASDGVSFANHLRRRAAAGIYETEVQLDGQPSPMPVSPPKAMGFSQATALGALGTVFGLNPVGKQSPVLEVAPANALHGIVGSITDSLSGNTGFTAAPTPPSGSIALGQDGDALKTVYKIVVLGPAFQKVNSLSGFPPFNDSAFFSFIPQWQSTLTTLSWEEWLLDIVIPILGSLQLPDGANIKGLSLDVIQELANVITNIPDLNASVTNGDFSGAMTSFIQTIVDNGTVRDQILMAFFSQLPAVTFKGQLVAAEEDLDSALAAVGWIELILQAIDSSAVLIASSTNNPGEEWTATVVQKKARLDPPTANVDQNHFTVSLTASPGTPSDPSVPFVYLWSVEGSAGGGLIDSGNDVGQEMMFQSTSNQAIYSPSVSASNGQTATVTVQVFTNGGSPSAPVKGTLLGQAQSVITIKFLPCDQALPTGVVSVCGDAVPSMTSVKPGTQLSVAVTLHTGGACGNGASLSLNGTLINGATLDGLAVQGDTVGIPGTASGTGETTHTVVFSISGNAPLQCPLAAITDPNQVIPTLSGPWVVLNEGTGGNFGGWDSVHPFVLEE